MVKRIFSLLLVAVLALNLSAQNNSERDTVVIKVKKVSKNSVDELIIEDNNQKWVRKVRRSNLTTNWFNVDLGFSNYVDNTVYASAAAQAYAPGASDTWFKLKNGKSINVNIWIVSQKLNLIKHAVNLKYALGLELNNYRYVQPIRYDDVPPAISNPPVVTNEAAMSSRFYKKTKLAADYVTLPVLLNFNLTPNRKYDFGFSAGVSAGYLYSARNKRVTTDEGKTKAKDDFDLNPWKLSYIGELNLGIVSLYGSYASKSMYKRGLEMTPYTIGLRIPFGTSYNYTVKNKR